MGRPLFTALCFLLSGACGLIYENVWIKQVSTVFGSTTLATTVVLGAFMGGLALGAWALGKRADQVDRPLATYAWLEVGITVAAFLFPGGLAAVQALYRGVLVPAGLPRGALLAYELIAVSALLIVPTALMGATLPVLMRFARGWTARAGAALGYLYAVNSAGAVVGSLAAGFFLIPRLGLDATSRVAQVLNLAVGFAALFYSATLGDAVEDLDDGGDPATAPVVQAADAPPAGVIHAQVFLCGFAAMLYEIALMKLLPLILGSSTYSFSLMLAAFICGIAGGSALWGALVERAERPARWLALLLLAQGLAFLASIPLYNKLPTLYLVMRAGAKLPFAVYQLASFGVCFMVMVVPTFFLGGVLPVAAQIVTRAHSVAGDVGRLYAANTAGNILGTVLTGLLFVPQLGFKRTMELGIALNLFSALWLLALDHAAPARRRLLAGMSVLAIVAAYLHGYPELDIARLNSGVYRLGRQGELALPNLERELKTTKVKFAREDETCFVTVTQNGPLLTLRVNGKPDASSGLDMQTQRMVAHWPLLLKPDAKRVLLIGLGSGVTADAALCHPIQTLECPELSSAVVDAAREFHRENRDVHKSERLALVVDDGRNYLERSNQRYDVIISEPSNPWVAGIGSLFTVECFRAAAAHLAPGGVMAQWIHTYEMDRETYLTVLRTFRAVFPHVTLMQSQKYDLIMLGSLAPLDLDAEVLAERIKVPKVAADLKSIGLHSALTLAAHHFIPEPMVALEAGQGPLNTDDHPLLEYLAPLGFYENANANMPPETYLDSPHHMLRRAVMRRPPSPAEVVELVQLLSSVYPPGLLADLLEESQRGRAPDVGLSLVVARLRRAAGDVRQGLEAALKARARLPNNAHVQQSVYEAALAVEAQEFPIERPWRAALSAESAKLWAQAAPEDPQPLGMLGMVLFRERRYGEAEQAFNAAVRLATSKSEQAPEILTWLYHSALARLERGDVTGAQQMWRELARHDTSAVAPALKEQLEYRLARATPPK